MTDALDPAALAERPGVQRVAQALAAAGSPDRIRFLDETARTAQDAASVLGVDVGQIVKSLLFTTPPETGDHVDSTDHGPQPLLVLTSGAHQVDTRKVADLLGVASIGRADADLVRAHTGFAIGGVAPVGMLHPMRVLVDVTLSRYDIVWAAAGHPHAVFPTTYEELLRLTAGQPVEVS
jgi:prolyl-tRNA editing enzyme YbaK/EbsC (Cys-tRNA(Pro) deacylase)